MSTVMEPDAEVKEDLWEVLNSIFERLGLRHGPPLGIGEAHITTEYPPLKKLLETLNPPDPHRDLGEFKDEEGQVWVVHREWDLKRQWRGTFGKVFVLRAEKDGAFRFRKVFLPQNPINQRFELIMATLGVRNAYSVAEAELIAQRRLFEQLSQQQRECYITTDGFAEVGRSGVIYILRKSRPTLAMRECEGDRARPLCALCLHPTAFYTNTWAGVLPPSDEVLAHLLMIRADERFLWRKANQLPLDGVTSGV